MSDNWITVIPEDPRFVPDASRQTRARDHFWSIAPESDSIEIVITEGVEFFHAGGNFETVRCPACRSEFPDMWWLDQMSKDYDGNFKLAQYKMPCCEARHTLHELIYEWPQGFGRFAIEAMNPNIGELPVARKRELEEILGTSLRVIYVHL